MSEIKNTIKVEVDGVKQFLSTTVQIEKELLQIEKALKEQGFKGNEKELKAAAKTYRREMLKSLDTIANEDKKNIKLKQKLEADNIVKNKILELKANKELHDQRIKQLNEEKKLKSSGLLDKIKGNLPTLTGGAVITTAAAYITNTVNEVKPLLTEVSALTKLSGEDLKDYTSQVLATSKTFEVDFNETLLATNTLVKEFGITSTEAGNLINQGFLEGANASGDLLSSVREYSTQFKAAGLDANDFFNILKVQTSRGIFDDKLVDAIKEGGLSLREMTKATSDALKPLGDLRNSEIELAVSSGKTFKAIQLVAQGMREVDLSASEAQTIIADVFKGAGEDVGAQLVDILADYNTELSKANKNTNQYSDSQEELLNAYKNLTEAQVALSDGLTPLFSQITTFAINGLATLINGYVKVVNTLKEWLGLTEDERWVNAYNIKRAEREVELNKEVLELREKWRKELSLLTTKEQLYDRARKDNRNELNGLERERLAQIENGVKGVQKIVDLSKEELLIKQKLGTLSNDESKKLDIILDKEKRRTEEMERQRDLRREEVEGFKKQAGITASDIDIKIGAGELRAAAERIKDLQFQKQQLENYGETLKAGEKSAEDLKNQAITAKRVWTEAGAEYTRVTDIIIKAIKNNSKNLSEQLTVSGLTAGLSEKEKQQFLDEWKDFIKGDLIEVFSTPTLSEPEANKIWEDILKNFPGITDEELFNKLKGQGISSPIRSKLLKDVIGYEKKFKELEKESEEQAKRNKDLGIDIPGQIKEIEGQIIKAQVDYENKKREIEEKAKQATEEAVDQIIQIQKELGLLTFGEAYQREVDKFAKANEELQAKIAEATDAFQKLSPEDQIGPLGEALANQLKTLNEQRISDEAKQEEELSKLRYKLSKEAVANFIKRSEERFDELTNALNKETSLLEDAEQERAFDVEVFDNRRKRANREYNDEEIKILEQHTTKIIDIENRRFLIERELRINAYIEELNRLANLGYDVTALRENFQNEEIEILKKHYAKIQGIIDKSAIEVEGLTKKLITAEEWKNIAITSAQSFSDVYSAYISFQESITQKFLDGIEKQISVVNEELATATSNIDALESDLEGKRSGRREAVLRGIEMEKERSEQLNEKKLELQREYQAAEKKAFEARKEAAIAQAIINGALAITATWAGYAGMGVPGAVIAGVQTASLIAITGLQVAEIANQEYVPATFAEGGMLEGPSHSNGGIPFTINGIPGFEAEGGEAIMSRRTVQMFGHQLNEMQKATGSKPLFADGGMVPNFSGINEALNGSSFRQIKELAEKPSYVNVTEIENLMGRRVKTTNITSI